MAKQQPSNSQIKTKPFGGDRLGAKLNPPKSAGAKSGGANSGGAKSGGAKSGGAKSGGAKSGGGKLLLLAALLAIVGWLAWTPGPDGLRERHAGVISKAEALRLPVNT